MASVSSPATPLREKLHPLDQLRGYIRTYVSLEALALAGMYLVLWFWIGLLLDYGVFKLTGIDWVQALPWWGFRAGLLAILVSGLVALVVMKLVIRVFHEFRDAPLALVLERRFPKELGDRLITAVELSDPKLVERYNLSSEMVDHTISEATDRVGKIPINQVFDWSRLRRSYFWFIGLTMGIYFLVGALICLFTRTAVDEYGIRFNQVAGIWFERNILLQNTIWPRKAYLELLYFPASGELRISRDSPAQLQVRALKWVIADRHTSEGWRGLRLSDLEQELIGMPVSLDRLPADWRELTMDQLEPLLDRSDTQEKLGADNFLYWREVQKRVEERATSPRMARRLRQLTVPDAVEVQYKGETMRSEQTLARKEGNEYAAKLADLRESVRFTVRALDYNTVPRRITLVPPPGILDLYRHEEQPAYLYHRPPLDGEPKDLIGKRQIVAASRVSLSGNVSRLEVPILTNLVLKGKADKALAQEDKDAKPPMPPGVQVKPVQGSGAFQPKITSGEDGSFEIRIDRIVNPLAFEIVLTDPDRVSSSRQIQIKPIEDAPPDVDVIVEVIRKTREGYLVTPIARVPFSGRIRDDRGLERVDYTYTVAPLDGQTVAVGPAVSVLLGPPPGPVPGVVSGLYIAWVGKVVQALSDDLNRIPTNTPVATFVRRLQEHGVVPEQMINLQEGLKTKPEKPLFRDVTLDPDEEVFDIGRLGLKASHESEIQPRFRMRLWLTAQDGNVESGPGIGQSREKLTFQVVSENELLAEVAKEEEGLHLKLEDTVNKLKDARNKLDQIAQELPSLKKEEFSPMARRAEEILDALTKGTDLSQDVHRDYLRILKELRANQVQPKIVDKVEHTICEPLEAAINVEFPASEKSMKEFHKTLEDAKAEPAALALGTAKDDLTKLIDKLTRVLDAMGDITTINKLIQQLAQIEKAERKASERFKETYELLKEKFLEDAFSTPKKP